jgi:hypothetical protein
MAYDSKEKNIFLYMYVYLPQILILGAVWVNLITLNLGAVWGIFCAIKHPWPTEKHEFWDSLKKVVEEITSVLTDSIYSCLPWGTGGGTDKK